MANTLFVGNLPLTVTEDELRRLFIQRGYSVRDIQIVRDYVDGRMQGSAFVTLSPHADRNRAIEDINGNDFRGRTLVVDEVRPRNYGAKMTAR